MEIHDRQLADRLVRAIEESPRLSALVDDQLSGPEGQELFRLEAFLRKLAPKVEGFHPSFDFEQGAYARKAAQTILQRRKP